MNTRRFRHRGVSLLEAVVALGVMAFGMLAVIGVQSTLRANGDHARQRSEAVRIAQESLEKWRAFAAIEATGGVFDYSEIVQVPREAVDLTGSGLGDTINTTFFRTVTVPVLAVSPRMKALTVTVDWTDRTGQLQSVQLSTLISGVAPELAGSVAIPPARQPSAPPLGRSVFVPIGAKDLVGTGTSAFVPPQSSNGTVAWVFNNITGLVTGICTVAAGTTTSALLAADVSSCSNNTTAQLLSGYVSFALGDPNIAPEAEAPRGSTLNLDIVLSLTSTHPSAPVCFDDAKDTAAAAAGRKQVVYYCLVYTNAGGTWAGRSRIAPRGFGIDPAWTIAASGAANYKVCRYTTVVSDTSPKNQDHPLNYSETGSLPRTSLSNQNFLVISGQYDCPTETPTAGDLFNSNTRLHQDGSASYDNP